MTPRLTFRPRDGYVSCQLDGKLLRLPTVRQQSSLSMSTWQGSMPSNGVAHWEKSQEFRAGKFGGAQRIGRFSVADHATLEVFDYPGSFAQRFDGDDRVGANGPGHNELHRRMARVTPDGQEKIHMHGPPACGNPRCIVITQGWPELLEALETQRRISIVVEL